jgi:hypothetical protein
MLRVRFPERVARPMPSDLICKIYGVGYILILDLQQAIQWYMSCN